MNASLSSLFQMTYRRKAHLIQGTLAPNHRAGLCPSGPRDPVACVRTFWVIRSGLSPGWGSRGPVQVGPSSSEFLCFPRGLVSQSVCTAAGRQVLLHGSSMFSAHRLMSTLNSQYPNQDAGLRDVLLFKCPNCSQQHKQNTFLPKKQQD